MYSMPYYIYASTTNFLVLEPTALTYTCIYQKNDAVTRIYMVLEIFLIEQVIRVLRRFFWGSTEHEWTLALTPITTGYVTERAMGRKIAHL